MRARRAAMIALAAAPIAISTVPRMMRDAPSTSFATTRTPVRTATRPAAPPATGSGKVVSDSDLAACLAQYPDVALPRERGDDAAARQTIVCRRGRILSYNTITRDPDWVMERLIPAMLAGGAKRSNRFAPDPLLGGADATNADYLASGFDRGHQAPAGDARFDQTVMDQSFLFTNMAPQIGIGFNRGVWKYLEETVRAWVTCGGHSLLYVVTGPIYDRRADAPDLGVDRVAEPVAFYKIVYDPATDRAVGFQLPNARIGAVIPDLQHYVRAIADIEADTGLDFFGGFDRRRQTRLEAQPGTAWGHVGACIDRAS